MVSFSQKSDKLMSEINIIPFTDILLVVLVIFMVTTPILVQSAIKVKLPQTQAAAPSSQEETKIRITVTEAGKIFLNNKEVSDLTSLDDQLMAADVTGKIVVVDADKKAAYGLVAQVLGIAQTEGALKLELSVQTQPKLVK